MKINVTADDIRLGIPNDGRHCPIAIAAQRAFGTKDVFVNRKKLTVIGPVSSVRHWWLPSCASLFTQMFDLHELVEPFSFDIPRVQHTEKWI